MYVLERLNVVKKVDSKHKADELEALGFTLVETPEEDAKKEDTKDVAKELDKKKVTELKDFAAEQGIDLNGAEKKADIIAAIIEATKEEPTEEEE